MHKAISFFILLSVELVVSCGKKQVSIQPIRQDIASFVYASGVVKSLNQYVAYPIVSGTIQHIAVTEGDTIKAGELILTLSNEVARLNQRNAKLAYDNSTISSNQMRLEELKLASNTSYEKYRLDSVLYIKQKRLNEQQIGSEIELDQKNLTFLNSKSIWQSAELRYRDALRQTKFSAQQSENYLRISTKQTGDFEIRSEINGRIYQLLKRKGELVTPQTPIAIIGDASNFMIEMQVDEFDISKISIGQLVYINMDSYKNQVFKARISKIIPMMNERTKSFTIEAVFEHAPLVLYPNLTLEANILMEEKKNVLVVPVSYVTDSQYVKLQNGEWVKVTTGLRNFEQVEIISGIDSQTRIVQP